MFILDIWHPDIPVEERPTEYLSPPYSVLGNNPVAYKDTIENMSGGSDKLKKVKVICF